MFTMATMVQGEWGTVETMTVGKCSHGYRDSAAAIARATERARATGKAIHVMTVREPGDFGRYATVDAAGRVWNETF